MKRNATAAEILEITIMENLNIKPLQYAEQALNATKFLLKDKTLTNNDLPEIVVFKTKLIEFFNKYNPLMRFEAVEAMEAFANITEYYFEQTEDEMTNEMKFIVNLLNKYDCQELTMKCTTHWRIFVENLTEMLEEFKDDLDQPILQWYEKFKKAKNLRDKISYIMDYLLLIRSF